MGWAHRLIDEQDLLLPGDPDDPATTGLDEPLPARLAEMLDYWRAKRRPGGDVPLRADIDPTEIPHLLGSLLLIERVTHPVRKRAYRWRLAGTEFERRFGIELTNRLLHETMTPIAVRAMEARYDRILESGRPHYLRQLSKIPGRNFVRFRRIAAPISSAGKVADMVLACWHWEN